MSDPSENQRNENVREGDGQRGQDQHYEYPKMLYRGEERLTVDDLAGEDEALADGWVNAPGARNPLADELAEVRAELERLKGGSDATPDAPRRGRPPGVRTAITE